MFSCRILFEDKEQQEWESLCQYLHGRKCKFNHTFQMLQSTDIHLHDVNNFSLVPLQYTI